MPFPLTISDIKRAAAEVIMVVEDRTAAIIYVTPTKTAEVVQATAPEKQMAILGGGTAAATEYRKHLKTSFFVMGISEDSQGI